MNAEIATFSLDDSSVLSRLHPPILGTLKAGSGELLNEGLILAKNAEGNLEAYDPEGEAPLNKPVGVLLHDCDSATDDAAVIVKHGTVVKTALLVGNKAPTAADLEALEALGIFAV